MIKTRKKCVLLLSLTPTDRRSEGLCYVNSDLTLPRWSSGYHMHQSRELGFDLRAESISDIEYFDYEHA